MTAPSVLFLSMPWSGVRGGALGISTLKAILARDGIHADARYFNVKFARQIGLDLYTFISERGGGQYRGEILFTPHCFAVPMDEFVATSLPSYYDGVFHTLGNTLGVAADGGGIDEFLRICEDICRRQAPSFLDECMSEIDWDRYDIVGFSLMFDQTLASVALARRIKQRFPEKHILFGGPSCEADMGAEMVRAFDCIDVVSGGESDETITALVRALRGGAPLEGIPGLTFRRDGALVRTPPAPPLANLDSLPYPDYSDYLAELGDVGDFPPGIYFETSRGCWWAQKHLCSFCGLNANGLAFRRKSPQRAVQEIIDQRERFHVDKLNAADNILDFNYFNSVLPQLAQYNAARERPEERLNLFYEVKSNLKKEQLHLMKAAGIEEVQPGIESFSDHVLELMDKGSTGIQQVQFVKWTTELGITATYGILHANPGETAADYDEMAEMVDFLRHLAPPRYVTPVILDRFSPYYQQPEKYGIRNVRPQESYKNIYPFGVDIRQIAYRFTYDHDDHHDAALKASVERCLAKMRHWRDHYVPDTLTYDVGDGVVYVRDRRGAKTTITPLRGMQAEVFLECDHHRSFPELQRRYPDIPADALRGFLDLLVARKWMWRDQRDRFIALPIRRTLSETAARATATRWPAAVPAEVA